jgi:glycine hydroxymethyltransferase
MTRLINYLKSIPIEKISPPLVHYLAALEQIEKADPLIAQAIEKELADQRSNLKMIASENYCSYAVQAAMGNFLTDKYAEGFARHRFYAGCENVDTVEEEATKLLKELFQAEAAYVQPHSGADANLVAFWAILTKKVQNPALEKLGKKSLDELSLTELESVRQLLVNQKILGLSLNSGGHLTHGYRHNVSGKMFQSVYYDVDPKSEQLDYKQIAEIARKEKPAILLAGYSSYPRKINFAHFKEIAEEVGATFMVDMAHFSGLVAGGVFQGDFNPIPFADVATSTTHKTLRGPRGGFVLCKKPYEEAVNKGCPLVLGGPLPHVMAAKAIAFKEALKPEFKAYTAKIVQNAQCLAESLKAKGFRLVSGGTDNHLLVIDLSSLRLTGRQGELLLRQGHITVNRNAIPYDPQGAWYTSGLRIGTPALTTLGMGPKEMEQIAAWIEKLLKNGKAAPSPQGGTSKAQYEISPSIIEETTQEIKALLARFPLYPELSL